MFEEFTTSQFLRTTGSCLLLALITLLSACQNPLFTALGIAQPEQENNTSLMAGLLLLSQASSGSSGSSDCTGGMNLSSVLQTGGNVNVTASTYHGKISGTDLYKAIFRVTGVTGKTVTLTSATTSGSNIYSWDGTSTCSTGVYASNDNQGSGDTGVTSFDFTADGSVWVVSYKTNSAGTISAAMN